MSVPSSSILPSLMSTVPVKGSPSMGTTYPFVIAKRLIPRSCHAPPPSAGQEQRSDDGGVYTSRPPARPWVNAIAFALILAGAVFAYLLYRLHRFAKASEGSVNPV